ncbi:MAG: 30S ribosomal protein S1 [Kiritimatiellae bacterium]|nr:30S ribosomal protein S1 [Kiritimatiellia bacterium]
MEHKRNKKRRMNIDLSQFSTIDSSEMEKMYEETIQNFAEGSIIKGSVLEVRNNEVLIDIGYKSEGVIPGVEFDDISALKPGDTFDVLLAQIEDDDGMVILSKEKADLQLRWQRVVDVCKEGSIIEGVVKSRVRGGLIVEVAGVEAFLPGSQIDVSPVHNMDAFIDNTYEFRVIKISAERRNIILSRRDLIEERLKHKKKELMATIEKGQKRMGKVKNITDFGVFVDLDGMDGLLHITDMSWGRIKHPSEMLAVGDELEVIILEIDHDRERVSLGLKQISDNPWEGIEERYPVGSRLRGKVTNLAPYGGFIELEEGVEGLVHVSEMSWTKRIARASDILAIGDEVDVAVLSVNAESQKIALGMRQTEDNPWDTVQARYPVGSHISGAVRNFTSYGAFIELEDGIDGMIHVSDMSWTRKVNHPSEVLEKGQEVHAVVLEVDPSNNRISLGLKQASDDPWSKVTKTYEVGQIVKGTVSKVASFGAFIEIADGVDGLVHISQISDDHVEKVKDVLKVGEEVEARIVKIDEAGRRIGLSMKAVSMPDDEFQRQKDDILDGLKPGDDMVNLGGAFDEALGLGNFNVSAEEWHPGEASDAAAEDEAVEKE